jgi:LPXTG-motif cell wall-anchored protein
MAVKKIFVRAGGLVAAAVLVSAGVSPANAVDAPPLPAGQQMFTFDFDEPPAYLWSVDLVDAGLEPIGLGTPDSGFIAAQQNPADGLVYAIGFDGTFPTFLASINMTTGVGEKIHNFVDGPFLTTKLLFNNAGDAFAIGADGPGSDPSIYDVNLENAVLSNPRSLGITDSCIFGAAHNPVDDTFYAFCNAAAYIIDWTTGVAAADPAHDLTFEDYLCPGITESRQVTPLDYAFDANGGLWVSSQGCVSELLFFDFATGSQTFVGQMHEATPSLYSDVPNYEVVAYGMLITTAGEGSSGGGSGSEELAATGSNSDSLMSAMFVGFALIVVGGLALRRRRAS